MTDAQPSDKNRDQRTETKDQRPETRDDRARLQCPNCCQLAPVTARRMGLLFYRCELCGSVGATPEPQELP